MKKLLLSLIIFCSLIPKLLYAQSQTIFYENFENGALGWSKSTTCPGYDWDLTTLVYKDGMHSMMYPSSNADLGCKANLISPVIQVNMDWIDTFFVCGWFYKIKESDDKLEIQLLDSIKNELGTAKILNYTSNSNNYFRANFPASLFRKGIVKFYVKFKVTSSQKEDVYIDSVSVILQKPRIKLIVPEGNDLLRGNEYAWIKWVKYLIDKVDLDYSIDDGIKWINIVKNNPNEFYMWKVPNISTKTCKIRVRSSSDTSLFDINDDYFGIEYGQSLDLKSPNGLELIKSGSIYPIRWESRYQTSPLDVYYTINSGVDWYLVGTVTDTSVKTINWQVPSKVSPVCLIVIKEKLLSGGLLTDTSYNFFAISNVTGLNKSEFENEIKVYPNPVYDVLNIELPANRAEFRITLSDLSGKRLFEKTYSNSVSQLKLELREMPLSRGAYILGYSDKKNLFINKLIFRD